MKRILSRAIAAVALFAACGGGGHDGRIGLTVPAGPDRVTKDTPFRVAGADRDGPAYRSGIRPNDAIVRINGREVDGMRYDDVREILGGPAGKTVNVTVERAGVTRDHLITRGR